MFARLLPNMIRCLGKLEVGYDGKVRLARHVDEHQVVCRYLGTYICGGRHHRHPKAELNFEAPLWVVHTVYVCDSWRSMNPFTSFTLPAEQIAH